MAIRDGDRDTREMLGGHGGQPWPDWEPHWTGGEPPRWSTRPRYGHGEADRGAYGRGDHTGTYDDEARERAERSARADESFRGRGPKGYSRSDERIREDVCERLAWHPEIDASEIEVTVKDGEVTLSGTVDERRQKRLAEDVAELVLGVTDVSNRVRISRAERPATS